MQLQRRRDFRDHQDADLGELREGRPHHPETGTILSVGDGIARIYGLEGAMAGELLEFQEQPDGPGPQPPKSDNVDIAVCFGDVTNVKEGSIVKRTGPHSTIPAVGEALVGRVVRQARPADRRQGPDRRRTRRRVELKAPGILARQPVKEPLHIRHQGHRRDGPDVGRGRREDIIGDRQTGKTAVALDTIISQGQGVYCYVAIGQKQSTVSAVVDKPSDPVPGRWSTRRSASPERAMAPLQFMVRPTRASRWPSTSATAVATPSAFTTTFRSRRSYRQLSLLLRRPPGREAYPGDVYLHSLRLLERAAKRWPTSSWS